ncbi:helix-turn-helix domain-containing protein [Methylobacterium longum]|uniref:Helix-turn-helix transcriptional regulator n=1 Tax=Methylobacterium longum TaxID=767694 RepID=A0ABT8AZ00_9HYPH|nr:helix-turn-helix transcriptional regulator [Methylobacterium longum]MDN3574651.1 helix-turn-helix transcriptional regulator [Methylobacterium longum]
MPKRGVALALSENIGMPPIAKPKRERRPSFLRQWRKSLNMTLEAVGEQVGMTGPNLGRIEKGEVPYSQDLLEQLAEIYGCEVADLLIRNPADPEGMWSLWQQAKPEQRRVITSMARGLLSDGSTVATANMDHDRDPSRKQVSHRTVKRRSA